MLAVLSLKPQRLIKSRQPNFLMQFTNWGPTKGRLYFMAYEQQDRYFSKSADSGNFVESAQMNLGKKIKVFYCLPTQLHSQFSHHNHVCMMLTIDYIECNNAYMKKMEIKFKSRINSLCEKLRIPIGGVGIRNWQANSGEEIIPSNTHFHSDLD